MTISIIAALSTNNVIGRDGGLPWDLPDDLKFFKDTTKGHPIIMGRRNFASIGRPLPKRRNIVVTRQGGLTIDGCDVVSSLQEAVDLASEEETEEIFIIGGGEIYAQALPLCDRLYLTHVDAEIEGDVYFPEVEYTEWQEVSREHHEADERHAYAFDIVVYDKR